MASDWRWLLPSALMTPFDMTANVGCCGVRDGLGDAAIATDVWPRGILQITNFFSNE